MSTPRIRAAGDSALLLELEPVIHESVNARAIAIATSVRAAAVEGVRDVVPTFRSVAVYFDPRRTSAARVRTALHAGWEACGDPPEGRHIEVPVAYGGEHGPDLDQVAAWAGLPVSVVVERHARPSYRVFMTGFLPGFAYMGPVDPTIAMPRRTPRLRVPAGSVGIGGAQTGVYPSASPGGWNLIGRSPMRLFDPDATPSAALAAGDRVTFVQVAGERMSWTAAARREPRPEPAGARGLVVLRPGLFTSVQDLGRWGHQAEGVSVAGSLDVDAHERANHLVGNTPAEAVLEATIQGPHLRTTTTTTLAVAGADFGVTVDGVDVPLDRAVRCRAGATVQFGQRRSGARAYLAFDGGIAVRPTLGSRATHVGASVGPFGGRAIMAGDTLPLGEPPKELASYGSGGARSPLVASVANGALVRVLPGPQVDFFPSSAFDVLQRTRFTVSPQSNRMGYRLEGGRVPRLDGLEMISDATFTGAIQVTPSGEPILLMADRQTTGGYPQIAVVITADLPRVAQLAPGDSIQFEVCSEADALRALGLPGAGES